MLNRSRLENIRVNQPLYYRKLVRLAIREVALIRMERPITDNILKEFNKELLENGIVTGKIVRRSDLEDLLHRAM